MDALLPIGKISKLFGTDGGLNMVLYDTFPGDIDQEEPLFVIIDGLAVPLFIGGFKRRGQSSASVSFDDIDTPERAGELIGLELHLATGKGGGLWLGHGDGTESAEGTDQDFTDDEVYLEELEGYAAVISEEGRPEITGTITDFIDSEMNPLFRIESAGREILIPASGDFIHEIDTATRTVTFCLPSGLLELYL